MHHSFVLGFNLSKFLLLLKIEFDSTLDGLFLLANLSNLLGADGIFEVAGFMLVAQIFGNGVVHPLFEIDIQLILERVSPVVFVGQELYTLLEVG